MQSESLARHMHEHGYYSRSLKAADQAIRDNFPELCGWKLDLFQRQYLESLERLGDSPEAAEGLTWTRTQRRARRRLTRSIRLWRRGALRTALEFWCLSASSCKSSQINAVLRLRSSLA